ncbi:MAG TPA: hypothetical protein VG412_09195 [Acidimicrobiales bacterium]|jgi:hypothetical protein|nr:hypothetical protein [Acidimicrobiales bacterium]
MEGPRDPDNGGSSGTESLRRRWQAQSYERTNLGWAEWNDSAVDPVIEDLSAGRDPWLSLRALVRARSRAGLSIQVVVRDLGALRDVDSTGGTRALSSFDAAVLLEDWYEEDLARRQRESVQDPITGLATSEFLKQYLRQLYRSVASLALPEFGHHLVIVDLPRSLAGGPLMSAQLACASLLTQQFDQGWTITVFNPHRQGVLASGAYVAHPELEAQLHQLEDFPAGAKPSVSSVDLPATAAAACDLIDTLSQA